MMSQYGSIIKGYRWFKEKETAIIFYVGYWLVMPSQSEQEFFSKLVSMVLGSSFMVNIILQHEYYPFDLLSFPSLLLFKTELYIESPDKPEAHDLCHCLLLWKWWIFPLQRLSDG